MSDEEAERIVKAAAKVVLDAILGLLQDDPHQWSTRPCPTCRQISGIVGRPFGCYLYAKKKQKGKE